MNSSILLFSFGLLVSGVSCCEEPEFLAVAPFTPLKSTPTGRTPNATEQLSTDTNCHNTANFAWEDFCELLINGTQNLCDSHPDGWKCKRTCQACGSRKCDDADGDQCWLKTDQDCINSKWNRRDCPFRCGFCAPLANTDITGGDPPAGDQSDASTNCKNWEADSVCASYTPSSANCASWTAWKCRRSCGTCGPSDCQDAPGPYCANMGPNKCHVMAVAQACPRTCWLCQGNYRLYAGIYNQSLPAI